MSRVQNTLRTVQDLLGKAQYVQARQTLTLAIQRDPGQPFLIHAMAVTLYRLGEHERALGLVRPLVAAHPNVPDLHCTQGMVLHALGRFDEAIASLQRAVDLNPGSATALMELGSALISTPRKSHAVDLCRRAVALDAKNPEAASRLILALHAASRSEEVAALARDVLTRFPDHYNARVALAHAGNYLSQTTPEQSLADHRSLGELAARLTRPPAHTFANSRDPERRLRVGFVSKDLRTHSVAFFLEPLLRALDRARLDVYLYSATRPEDGRTEMFRGLVDGWGGWRPVFGVSGLPLARAIRADAIDVLLELGGLTSAHLFTAYVHRAAPVQVTYLGYPNTTGLASMDFRLVDSNTDPEGADRWCTERLVRMDPCFLCFSPPTEAPPPARTEHEGVTFGSFNAMQKVSDAAVAVWSRLVNSVPSSRLLLKSAELADAEVRARVQDRFARAGIATERLELLATTPTIAEHLALYGRIDVGLDTFPYAGTTTTCEALWMGVPVVTLAGATHASRVGISLLRAVGVPELIAASEDEYVRLAADLARDESRLSALRSSLRPAMAASPLCDAPGLARRFEGALRGMWRAWCATGT